MFELKNTGDKWHFVLKSDNGQVILSSQMYASRAGAIGGIKSVKKNAELEMAYDLKESKNNKWHFNMVAKNKQVIGSSQMYASMSGANNGINSIQQSAPTAQVKEKVERFLNI